MTLTLPALDRLHRRLSRHRSLGRDRAAVAITFALASMPLVGAVGMAVDSSRAYAVQTKLQWALDNAILAVGSTGKTGTAAQVMIQRYVDANINGPIATANPVSLPVITRETVTQAASADVDTIFMGALGIDEVQVGANVVVRRQQSAMMLSLVLDVTGSMWSNSNIASLRNATKDLTDYLFAGASTSNDLRVAIVPYAASVNVGPAAAGIVKSHTLGAPHQTDKLAWKGCVFERPGALSLDDTPPTSDATRWTPFRWDPSIDNAWTAGNANSVANVAQDSNGLRGPNLGCGNPILPLTGTKADVDSATNAITAWNRGGTLTDIGIAWGLRVLSPGAPFTESAATDTQTGQSLYASSRWEKAIVIMTDGESQTFEISGNQSLNGFSPANQPDPTTNSDVTAYGRINGTLATSILGSYVNHDTTRSRLQTRIEALCTRAKNEGITVYTVVFTSSVGQAIRDSYRRCASDPGKYWYAPNGTELRAAFGQIGRDLHRLRVAQ